MTDDTPRRAGSRPGRAVSITVNYVIVLGITAVLVSGLLVGAGGYVQDQRTSVVREELTVVAERLAAGIADADRLARADAQSRSVRVGVRLPARVAGESYRITVTTRSTPGEGPMRYALTLRSSGTDVRVTLTTSTLVGIEEGSVSGGWVVVRADAGDSTLVLADGDPSGSLSLAPPASGVTHA
ncbi:hypothetical protein GCM10008995_07550 [Halobellus salinus]|uniref:Uncharacterized protein n=1 Tax=Halobellus salinus TaxID=931585 RepID=A0A830EKN1_9EURY|nr:hypothetical protein [Halobellus salinus]GGJ00199.1 hypothetical protein GCM10008995_07550 [Halobellus salinus]SMP01866.1 hypothetical protein SAMN06265347_101153 [Halobellus salinus]